MPFQPLVSVVTPSYNQARFVRLAIESVLGQDYPLIEYSVYDGGSTDGSVEIIREFQDQLAFWVSEPDAGQADAVNRGWQRSRGEILAWLNSDDVYEPGAVSAVVEAFRRHPWAGVVSGDCQVIDEAGAIVKSLPSSGFSIHALLAGNSLPQQGVFCRRSAVAAAGWPDTSLNYVFDWALWLRLWLHGVRFYHLRRVLAGFRLWDGSKTPATTVGASLSGGMGFARERYHVLADLVQEPHGVEAQESPLLREARLGCMLEMALLHQIAAQSERAAFCFDQFATETPDPARSLPYPQALAAHLAYLAGDIDRAIKDFVGSLASVLRQRHLPAYPTHWTRALRAETFLVQAWDASHYGDDARSAHCFARALLAHPSLLLQRRVISPATRHSLKALAAGRGIPS
ncbi:glycosyltransferase family 2 protein [Chloroflexota bacterium]